MSKKDIQISKQVTELDQRGSFHDYWNIVNDFIFKNVDDVSKDLYYTKSNVISFDYEFANKHFESISRLGSIEKIDYQQFEDFAKGFKKTKPSEIERDLSEYIITSDGLINENWLSVVLIPSQIFEVNNEHIFLECLIDYEKRILEKRKFRRGLIEGKCKLSLGNIVLLKISEKPGKMLFEFDDGANLGYEKYFSEEEYITDLEKINTGKLIK